MDPQLDQELVNQESPPHSSNTPSLAAQEQSQTSSLRSALENLRDQLQQMNTNPSVFQILSHLGNYGRTLAIFTLSTPFVQPIPVPGLSVVLGLIIAFLSLGYERHSPITLPARLGAWQMNRESLRKSVAFTLKLLTRLEKWTSPGRWEFAYRALQPKTITLSLLFSGIALALPIPPVIPFSNSIPAWSAISLCVGIFFRDGVWLVIGNILAIATWVYFAWFWQLIMGLLAKFW